MMNAYTFQFEGLVITVEKRRKLDVVIRAASRAEAWVEAGQRAAKLCAAEVEVDCVELVQVK